MLGQEVTPTVLNLNDLCGLLQRALAADGRDLQCDDLLALLKRRLAQKGGSRKVVTLDGGIEVCDLCVLYPVYADWVTDIGFQLGFQCQAEPRSGEWCSDMVNTLQVFTTLRRLIMVRLEGLEQEQAAGNGYGLVDVVEKSAVTGELHEQSKARLHALCVGLKPVGSAG
jgi:hypothetical protein